MNDFEKQIKELTAGIYENVDNTFIAEDEENNFYSETYAELLKGWIIG